MRILTLFSALLLVGCAPESADPDANWELEQTLLVLESPMAVGGCGDFVAYAGNPSDTRGMYVWIDDGIVQDASDNQTEITRTYDLPHPDVVFEARWGSLVLYEVCNDILDPDQQINGTAQAISGTITVTVGDTNPNPEPWDLGGRADVIMTDVTFENDATGGTRSFNEAELHDLYVGWLPG